eukprot:jgi/Hompol1/4917/HPOL_001862-RA
MYSDIVVSILGKDFRLHRIVLATNEYFGLRLGDPGLGEQLQAADLGSEPTRLQPRLAIQLADPRISLDAATTVLRRIYGEASTPITSDNALSLLAAGYLFSDTELSQAATAYIITHLDATAIQYYLSLFEQVSYGQCSDQIIAACVEMLCSRGSCELADTMHRVPLYWFAKIAGSDLFWCPSEYERYRFLVQSLERRRVLVDQEKAADAEYGGDETVPFLESLDSLHSYNSDEDDDDDQWTDDLGSLAARSEASRSLKRQNSAETLNDDPVSPICNPKPTTSMLLYKFTVHRNLEQVFAMLLTHSVNYSQMTFDELQAVRSEAHVPPALLTDSAWKQLELDKLILTASKHDKKLGIEVASRPHIPAETISECFGSDSRNSNRKFSLLHLSRTDNYGRCIIIEHVINAPFLSYATEQHVPFRLGLSINGLQSLASTNRVESNAQYHLGRNEAQPIGT